ncbi:hypothetical protein [Thalassospira marina]|uniref:Uncharacterized protein n=1 Tax=Thalassospira marina TaxID=2048283 RepID=A0A2N3KTK6_9PROT|nr:hypothetical protein [Thalassospira marina]AUG55734.1 hypothetical protein CSC3H3_23085 [Thalassospira marina]PKR53871.1 hypothetical protein COO20_12755 [Thalassospira marina]
MDRKLLDHLDKDALIKLADAYEDFARKARAKAEEIAERESNLINISARLNSLKAIGYEMSEMLNQYEQKQVEKILSNRHSCPPETVAHYYKMFLKANDAATVRARHLMVTKLAARGFNNRQIAKRTGLHEVSVSRILRPILRPGHLKQKKEA